MMTIRYLKNHAIKKLINFERQKTHSARTQRLDNLIICVLSIVAFLPWLSRVQQTLQTSIITFPFYQKDELHYIARARAGWERRNLIEVFSNSNFYSEDGLFIPFEYLVFYFLRPLKFLGLDFNFLYFTVVFISILLCVGVIYKFFYQLRNDRYISAFLTVVICFNDIFERFSFQPSEALLIARWPYPALHYLIIFHFLRLNFGRERKKYDGIYSSLLIALGFYSYFYTWQILGAIIISLSVVHALSKNFDKLKQLVAYSAIGLMLSIPYLSKQIKSLEPSELEFSELFLTSMGKTASRQFQLSISIIILIFASLYFCIKSKSKNSQFAIVVATSSLLVYNQHVLSGILIQPGHYHWYWIKPMALVLIILLVVEQFDSGKILTVAVSILMTVLLLASSFQNIFYADFQPINSLANDMNEVDFRDMTGVAFSHSAEISDILITNSNLQLDWHLFSKFYRGQDISYREAQVARLAWNKLSKKTSIDESNQYATSSNLQTEFSRGEKLLLYFRERGIKWIFVEGKASTSQLDLIARDYYLFYAGPEISVFRVKSVS